ncbi:MAG: hypothetical protein ACRD21_06935 [Vicinamibacteria bacterium]
MDSNRRRFLEGFGGTAAAALLWDRAEAEVEQSGAVQTDTLEMLLDHYGSRGIYDVPERFEELRAAVARTIPSARRLREFPIPQGVPPALVFRRG